MSGRLTQVVALIAAGRKLREKVGARSVREIVARVLDGELGAA